MRCFAGFWHTHCTSREREGGSVLDWKDKLCGSKVQPEPDGNQEGSATVQKLLASNEILSCGGGFYPVVMNNTANMKTFRSNFILPTSKYSVLVFKEDGNAVIYSEDEEVGGTAPREEGEA